jgi:chaperone modulatory protein CbpM
MRTSTSVTLFCETVQVVEEEVDLSLTELCRCVGASAELVAELVDHGLLTPREDPVEGWRFGGASLAVTRRALRLMGDLGVNAAGAAVAIELLDRIERLERAQRG